MTKVSERIIRHPFFAGMEEHFLPIVILNARERVFAPGEIIFYERTPASQFYLIESGRVALAAHEPAEASYTIQELHAGEVLGWSWLCPPFVWHFQARALEPTKVIVLDGAHLLIAAEQNKQFGFDLLRRVSRTMMQRLQAARTRLIESEKREQTAGNEPTCSRFDPCKVSIGEAGGARHAEKEKV